MLKNRRSFSQAANNKLDGRVCMKEASYLINVEFFTASICFRKTTRGWHKWFILPPGFDVYLKNASFTSYEYRRESVRELLKLMI